MNILLYYQKYEYLSIQILMFGLKILKSKDLYLTLVNILSNKNLQIFYFCLESNLI